VLNEFTGRVAVITGAASGIGRALAGRCGGLGMKVVLADVEADALEHAAAELKHNAPAEAEFLTVQTDVLQADSVSALAERSVDAFGGVHLLCNNAGVFAGGLSWDAPMADWEWVYGVNTFGVVHGLRSFVPLMLEQGEPAHILNTASMAALTTAPFSAAYCSSKAAVMALSESLFLELRGKGAPIGVSVLCPELVDTGIGRAHRNRPEHLARKDADGASPERDMVENAIGAATATGLDPFTLADRALEAVRNDQFYVLAAEGDPWRVACNTRLDDIRLARNPSAATPGS
jgi:NAD(P)-dependent dehydrogenase (short-subunit alcohol dehydrogenase family)